MVRFLFWLAVPVCVISWSLMFLIQFNPLNCVSAPLLVMVQEQERSRKLDAKMATIAEMGRFLKKIDTDLIDARITLLEAASLVRDAIEADPEKSVTKGQLARFQPCSSFDEVLCRYLIWRLHQDRRHHQVCLRLQEELKEKLYAGQVHLPITNKF